MEDEIILNQKLYNAIASKDFNPDTIEELLQQGANPCGYINDDHDTCTLSEFLYAASYRMSSDMIDDYRIAQERLSTVIRLFLKHGLLDRLFYNEEVDGEYLPIACMHHSCSREAAISLKMILDEGYRGASIDGYINGWFIDVLYLSEFVLSDEVYLNHLEWGSRMLMLIASYQDIFDADEYVRSCVNAENNDVRILSTFRDIDAYTYQIKYNSDMCEENPALGRVTIKDGVKNIWTFDFV